MGYKNSGKQDQWVSMSFTSTAAEGLACHLDGHEVCSFVGIGQEDMSTCAFLLPSGGDLSCKASAGSPTILTMVGAILERQLGPLGEEVKSTCPPTTGSNTTLCDCSYTNPTNTDMVVVMNAKNMDNKFN